MRIEQDGLGRLKQWIYISASAVLFITWCLSLSALTQAGTVDGRLGWVFGLVSTSYLFILSHPASNFLESGVKNLIVLGTGRLTHWCMSNVKQENDY